MDESLRRKLAAEMTHQYPVQSERPLADMWAGMNNLQRLGLFQIPVVSDAAGLLGDLQMYRDQPDTRGLLNYGMSAAGLLPFVPGAFGIIAKDIDPNMLPRVLREIGERDEFLVRKAGQGTSPYRESVREGRQAYEVVPTNTEGFIPYYGSTYKFAGQPEQHVRPAFYDPRISYLAENNYDEMITRTPYLKPGSGFADDVPAIQQPGVIYRGMSAPEYRDILKSGRIRSKGDYNIGEQQRGTTSFTIDPRSAQSYAGGFAPAQFQAAPGAPSYIVGVNDPETAIDIAVLRGSHERSIPGEIPIENIVSAYEGVPYAYRPGWYEVGTELGYPVATNGTTYSPFLGWRQIMLGR